MLETMKKAAAAVLVAGVVAFPLGMAMSTSAMAAGKNTACADLKKGSKEYKDCMAKAKASKKK